MNPKSAEPKNLGCAVALYGGAALFVMATAAIALFALREGIAFLRWALF
jgi:hypothetical protein